jgi:hypothetical protein
MISLFDSTFSPRYQNDEITSSDLQVCGTQLSVHSVPELNVSHRPNMASRSHTERGHLGQQGRRDPSVGKHNRPRWVLHSVQDTLLRRFALSPQAQQINLRARDLFSFFFFVCKCFFTTFLLASNFIYFTALSNFFAAWAC